MSHFSRIRTTFRHREALVQCMQDLGYSVETDTTIKGYHGLHNVDIAARKSGGYALGFVKSDDGVYDLVADWWGVSGKGELKVVEELKRQAGAIQQEYAKRIVLEQARKNGFELVSEKNGNDGTVQLVVRRWK